ncbi:hypothetical protein P5673_000353 [Acropora cervicornis]|uniref:Uncharacterized protein n=1 Tax=Acropora cervicornis TaxID=6130 RepID=A0AAD9VH22_ACRCE|nr:hypothetical protein P5673_000353 [Acropora cervicornis]
MNMTSPCQRCVTYQPLGIQVYFNAKIIFCSSDQREEALLISAGRCNESKNVKIYREQNSTNEIEGFGSRDQN